MKKLYILTLLISTIFIYGCTKEITPPPTAQEKTVEEVTPEETIIKEEETAGEDESKEIVAVDEDDGFYCSSDKDKIKDISKIDYYIYLTEFKGKEYRALTTDYNEGTDSFPSNDYFLRVQKQFINTPIVYKFTNARLVQYVPNEGSFVKLNKNKSQLYFVKGLKGIDNTTIDKLYIELDGSYSYNSNMGLRTVLAFNNIENRTVQFSVDKTDEIPHLGKDDCFKGYEKWREWRKEFERDKNKPLPNVGKTPNTKK